MIDLCEGHIKLYLYKDDKLFKNIKNAFKDDDLVVSALNHHILWQTDETPYYVRIKNGQFSGNNYDGDFHVYDTDDMITVNGYDLLKIKNGIIPEEMFTL